MLRYSIEVGTNHEPQVDGLKSKMAPMNGLNRRPDRRAEAPAIPESSVKAWTRLLLIMNNMSEDHAIPSKRNCWDSGKAVSTDYLVGEGRNGEKGH